MNRRLAEELFHRFQESGNPDDLVGALDLSAKGLEHLALRLAGNVHDAADLLQATFLSVLESAERFDSDQQLRAWLAGILANHARRFRRQSHRKPDPRRLVKEPDGDPAVAVAHDEVRQLVDRAIAGLPPAYRNVLLLHVEEGITSHEIAERLRRSPSTVRTQLQRGLEMLRKSLPPMALLVLGSELCASAARGMRTAPAPREEPGAADVAPQKWRRTATIGVAAVCAAVVLVTAVSLFGGNEAEGAGRKAPTPLADSIAAGGDAASPVGRGAPTRTPIDTASSRGTTVGFRLSWRESGTPAAALSVRLYTGIEPGSTVLRTFHDSFLHAASDERGEVRFEDAPPGHARLLLDDGQVVAHELDLEAGEHLQIDLDIQQPTVTAHGVVRGPKGHGVPNAEIWLSSTRGFATPGYHAGTADADGRYLVHAFGKENTISAHASGYADSAALLLKSSGPELPTDVGVRSDPCVLEGSVVDVHGEPLEGVVVGIAPTDNRDGRRAMSLYCATDASGRFRLDRLFAGRYVAAATARRGAPVWSAVEILAGAPAAVALRIEAGGQLRGRVTGWEEFIQDLRVVAHPDLALEFRSARYVLQTGATVAQDGSFVLDELPAGPLVVQLHDARRRRLLASRSDVHVDAGTTSWLDLSPSDEGALAGRVVRSDGTPLAGARVSVEPLQFHDPEDAPRTVEVDADGTFRITPLAPVEHRLLVTPPGASLPVLMPIPARARGPVPDLVVDPPVATATVSGRLLDEDGTPRAKLWLGLISLRTGRGIATAADASGRFAFDGIEPGEYWIQSQVGQTIGVTSQVRVNRADLDTGDLLVPDPVRVTFELTGCDRIAGASTPMSIITPNGAEVHRQRSWHGRPVVWRLLPGDYVFRFLDADLSWKEQSVPVATGGKSVDLRLQPSALCELSFPYELPPGATSGSLRVEIENEQRSASILLPVVEYGRYVLRLPLVRGRYTGRASTFWGTTTDFEFEVGGHLSTPVLEQRL